MASATSTAARSTVAMAVEAAWASDRPTYQPQMATAPPPPPPPTEPPYQVTFNDTQARCFNCCVYSVIFAVIPVMLPCLLKRCFPRPQRAIIDDAAIRYNDAPPVQLPNVTRVALSRQVCCWCVEEPMLSVSETRGDKPVSLEAPRRPQEVRDEIVRRWGKAVLRDVGGSDSGSGCAAANAAHMELASWSAWATSTWATPPRRSVTLDKLEVGDAATPVVISFDDRAAAAHLTCEASLMVILLCLIPCLPCLPFLAAREARHQRCVIDDRAISMREVTSGGCFGLLSEFWVPLDRVADVQVSAPFCAAVVAAAPDVQNVKFTVQGVKGPEGAKAFTSMLAVKDAAAVKELIELRKRALMERISQISTESVGLDDPAATTAIEPPPTGTKDGEGI